MRNPDGKHVAELRPIGSADPLPAGWVTEPLRWHGQDDTWEVAFDPREVSVVRTGRELRSGGRRTLTSAGYRAVASDTTGSVLWVADATELALARLDRAANRRELSTDSPALGL